MRIWNQWVADSQTVQHTGSLCPPMTNAREDRRIVRSALQNRTTTSRTVSRKWACLQHAQYSLVWCDDVCSSVVSRQGGHYFGIYYGGSAAPNNKTGYRGGTVSSFQTSFGSVCSILIAVCVSGGMHSISA
ncbi:hypothetical protein TNCV_4495571 [Trichonephila clavipes]|nr:hypothetical protein TNCV_4495571 [Trichonephila clavipes]